MTEHLSARGKNLLFYEIIGDALQLDKIKVLDNKTLKKACTPNAIRKIHEAIPAIWPSEKDLVRVLKAEKANTSALYIGHYEPISILQGVTRHSMYSEKILIIDPFTDPRNIRLQYSPLQIPESHIENTIKDVRLWLVLVDWDNTKIHK